MPDPFGLSEGVKALSGSLDSSREAAKGLSKSIEGIQQDAIDVAQKQAQERRRAAREAEFKKEQALIKALKQWQHSKQILQSSRAQQEGSVLMNTLVHDLRRAHFHSSNLVNNGSQDAHCPSQFCGALEDFQVSAQQILFSVDRNENGIKENNECSGFRFYANQVQMKTACKPVVWTALTKFQNWHILAFEIQLQCDPVSLSQVVNLTMAIRKQLSSDTTAMTWQRQVRLRNASTRARHLGPFCQSAVT